VKKRDFRSYVTAMQRLIKFGTSRGLFAQKKQRPPILQARLLDN